MKPPIGSAATVTRYGCEAPNTGKPGNRYRPFAPVVVVNVTLSAVVARLPSGPDQTSWTVAPGMPGSVAA